MLVTYSFTFVYVQCMCIPKQNLVFFSGNYSVRDDPVAQVCTGIVVIITLRAVFDSQEIADR
jgi:hypothetical protein